MIGDRHIDYNELFEENYCQMKGLKKKIEYLKRLFYEASSVDEQKSILKKINEVIELKECAKETMLRILGKVTKDCFCSNITIYNLDAEGDDINKVLEHLKMDIINILTFIDDYEIRLYFAESNYDDILNKVLHVKFKDYDILMNELQLNYKNELIYEEKFKNKC